MVENTMDALAWLRKRLEQASPDLLREMVESFAQALMSAEADALCGAPYGELDPMQIGTNTRTTTHCIEERTGRAPTCWVPAAVHTSVRRVAWSTHRLDTQPVGIDRALQLARATSGKVRLRTPPARALQLWMGTHLGTRGI